ncbi:hypothetical protein [Campylobacter sp. MG1]|uniref:hypothetical protein n=1 Tax=Campylobacter sp. MG1 TaxID=2976332 RepID=UPI00226D3148|nr:hypothetical protein [Campylobacter sp. MG1]
MNEVDYLKSFSLKEIVNKTHLDEVLLKAIIERDFEKLKNANITMNLKILEREYNINFEDWLKAFNDYKLNNFVEGEKGLRVKPKLVSYNSINDKVNYTTYLIYFLIAIIIIGGGFFYYLNYMQNNESITVENIENNQISNEIPNIEPIQNQVVEEVSNELPDTNSEVNINDENTKNENESNVNNNTNEMKPIDANSISLQINEIKKDVDDNKEEVIKHKLGFTPFNKSWVNVINLSTKESKNYMVDKGIVFEEDVLILVGNHLFTLDLDGNNIELPTNDNARYILFKDGEVKFLTKKEYSKIEKAK